MLHVKGSQSGTATAGVLVALLLMMAACDSSPQESQPAVQSQPAAISQPAVQSQPAATSALATQSQPVATSALATQSQPAVQSQPAKQGQMAPQIASAPQILQAVSSVLNPDTGRKDVPRLARATIDTTGDVTVVFALRNEHDDKEATRTTALADTLAILWAVYHSPNTDRITTTTVVGTYAIQGKTGRTRELPVLRAVLSAQHAAQLDWKELSMERLPQTVDLWWMHVAMAPRGAGASQAELEAAYANTQGDTEGRAHKPLGPAEVHAQIDRMLLHLNEALHALSGNDVGVARSQFKQFFEKWDGAEEELRVMYPQQYAQLDQELQRAEVALLHTMPEDVNTGRFALRALRAGLLDVAHDLEAKLN
jgi:hypothetical protein